MRKLREMESAATPAPWMAGRDGAVIGDAHVRDAHVTANDEESGLVIDVWATSEERMNADAAFIAEWRNAAQLLLAVLDAASAIKRTNWYADALGRNDDAAIALWNATVALDEATS